MNGQLSKIGLAVLIGSLISIASRDVALSQSRSLGSLGRGAASSNHGYCPEGTVSPGGGRWAKNVADCRPKQPATGAINRRSRSPIP
jgi:hypothetical protein